MKFAPRPIECCREGKGKLSPNYFSQVSHSKIWQSREVVLFWVFLGNLKVMRAVRLQQPEQFHCVNMMCPFLDLSKHTEATLSSLRGGLSVVGLAQPGLLMELKM